MLNTGLIGMSVPNETENNNGSVIQPEDSSRARILVADDHFLIAETIAMLLAPHFDVVGVVTDAKLVAVEVADSGRRSCYLTSLCRDLTASPPAA